MKTRTPSNGKTRTVVQKGTGARAKIAPTANQIAEDLEREAARLKSIADILRGKA